jgi:DNA-binding transcriptional LysR family regulator
LREAQLRDFIAVIEEGGVRAAGRKLGLTQAAVSSNLRALERECGQLLLVRSHRGVELTEAGHILLRRARAAQSELRRAKEELEAFAGRPRGGVSIGLTPSAEATLLPAAYQRFRKRYPDVALRVIGGVSAMTVRLLQEGRLDFIIGSPEVGRNGGLRSERLFSVDLIVVARAGHPLQNATQLADLISSEWVTGVSSNVPHAELHTIFGALKLPTPRIGIQRESGSVFHFIKDSERLALVARPSVDHYCDAGLLRVLPLRDRLPSIVMHLLTVEGRPLTDQATALAGEFKRAARAWQR